MKFKDIPKLTRGANYKVNQSWCHIEETLQDYCHGRELAKLDLNPDFQRGHVWTNEQRIAYIEFKLRGEEGSNELKLNCVGWMDNFEGPFVLVDGKQRLQAVLKFLHNKIKVFGKYYYQDFTDRLPYNCDFVFHINNLSTMKEVYQWYLELNGGGTPHTKAELDKVRAMLK